MNPLLQHGPERHHPSFDTLSIGDTIYNFDINRRIYKTKDGRRTNTPIFAGYFEDRVIAGETKLCWLVTSWPNSPLDRATKVNKKTLLSADKGGTGTGCAWHTHSTRYILTWIHLNEKSLVKALENCKDIDKLKAIAAFLDHQEILTEL